MDRLLRPLLVAPPQLGRDALDGSRLPRFPPPDEAQDLVRAVSDDLLDEQHVGKLMPDVSGVTGGASEGQYGSCLIANLEVGVGASKSLTVNFGVTGWWSSSDPVMKTSGPVLPTI